MDPFAKRNNPASWAVSSISRTVEDTDTEASMDADSATSFAQEASLADELREHRPDHPVLARVHQRLADTEDQQITSYDRMHHRHNRS